jgi:hypothetical protein
MDELTHIGLDVHKETIAVAVLRPNASDCDERVIPNTPEALRKLLARYPDRSACVFRAKPNTDSTPSRTPIPRQAEHRFHGKPNSESTPRRTVS